jgi:hypothetical protein
MVTGRQSAARGEAGVEVGQGDKEGLREVSAQRSICPSLAAQYGTVPGT